MTATQDANRLARILAARAGGATLAEIGRHEGISRQRVHELLRAHAAGDATFAGRTDRAARMATLGLTREQIAYVEDVAERAIRETAQKDGAAPPRAEVLIAQEAERNLLAKLYAKGLSTLRIAALIGTSPDVIRRRLLNAGVTLRGRSGEMDNVTTTEEG